MLGLPPKGHSVGAKWRQRFATILCQILGWVTILAVVSEALTISVYYIINSSFDAPSFYQALVLVVCGTLPYGVSRFALDYGYSTFSWVVSTITLLFVVLILVTI